LSQGEFKRRLEKLRDASNKKNVDFPADSLANHAFALGVEAALKVFDYVNNDFPYVILDDTTLGAKSDVIEKEGFLEDSDFIEKKELIIWFKRWFGEQK